MPIDFHSDSNRYSYAGRTASLEWRRVHSIPSPVSFPSECALCYPGIR
ncbi:hypothetical protein ERICI_04431 [Paenibacillus larvae subsp. larvae]|uniref:Uncharacterized protein n=2 Tax=Paenibacillus larvae subsp. larvae TaxID=147375 RepID=V9WCV1_9BACL|nr:hypothetical protein ERIC2_c40161 [Paenibacillus larvae subsp. larvae DSM 25430]AVF24106.1 hypothetical protein ERICI_04431 [Paenibacillus larvae subsp. larvae]ETK28943.1 hypothetical protein ERIC1_1c24400 [Paenibacillus larvae subsp. larvae DSM 25719]QHZ53822.1 hypothetical protein ERICV_04832 [Paenibacillus larvae subsp. larvae]